MQSRVTHSFDLGVVVVAEVVVVFRVVLFDDVVDDLLGLGVVATAVVGVLVDKAVVAVVTECVLGPVDTGVLDIVVKVSVVFGGVAVSSVTCTADEALGVLLK